jgi:hypothetical protein
MLTRGNVHANILISHAVYDRRVLLTHLLTLFFLSYCSVYIDNVLKLMRQSHKELEKKMAKNPEWVELWANGRPSGTYKVRTYTYVLFHSTD